MTVKTAIWSCVWGWELASTFGGRGFQTKMVSQRRGICGTKLQKIQAFVKTHYRFQNTWPLHKRISDMSGLLMIIRRNKTQYEWPFLVMWSWSMTKIGKTFHSLWKRDLKKVVYKQGSKRSYCIGKQEWKVVLGRHISITYRVSCRHFFRASCQHFS